MTSGILILIMLTAWWKNWRTAGDTGFFQALNWTIIVGLLVTFQTGTTNQVLLLIPLFVELNSIQRKKTKFMYILGILLTWGFTWTLFLSTLDGNYENVIMFLPLPLLALAYSIIRFFSQGFRQGKSTAHLS